MSTGGGDDGGSDGGGDCSGSDGDVLVVVVVMVTLVDVEMVVTYYPVTGRDSSGKGASS